MAVTISRLMNRGTTSCTLGQTMSIGMMNKVSRAILMKYEKAKVSIAPKSSLRKKFKNKKPGRKAMNIKPKIIAK
jgi:hypothetical protein